MRRSTRLLAGLNRVNVSIPFSLVKVAPALLAVVTVPARMSLPTASSSWTIEGGSYGTQPVPS
jgi:hypothetical protein